MIIFLGNEKMLKNNLAEMPENYDMADDVKASTFMTETEVQATVASNVNDNREGDFPPPPKGGAATKAVEENTVNKDDPDISRPLSIEDIIKNKQLSPETLTEIINAAQNDNLFLKYHRGHILIDWHHNIYTDRFPMYVQLV